MSNETPDTPDTPGVDASMRRALSGVADHVDVGLPDDTLSNVRTIVGRRRRRRNALMGTAAAATLVVGGVVVANVAGNDGDDRIVSAPATDAVDEPGQRDESAEPVPDNDTTPIGTAGTAPADATSTPAESTAVGAATAQAIAPDESFVLGSYQQVLPWNDGFLVIGQTQADQALPTELPEEISAAFPPEVVQFFEDAGGLPPTIAEATQMLQEAGLFDVVSDVVLNNPEVSDAIYSVPPAPPIEFARLSTDGINWTDIDLDLPADAFGNRQIVSTGDRLAVITTEHESTDEAVPGPMSRPEQVVALEVHTTTDLQTWTTQRAEIAPSTAELAPYLNSNTYVNGVGVNDAGWVANLMSFQDVDYEALLPDDFDRSFMESEFGWGIYHDADGIVLETYDEMGNGEQRRVPWTELGFTEAPEGIDVAGGGPTDESTLWSASWDGQPTPTTSDGFGQIYGFDSGFIQQGERMSFSVDGTTWTDFDRPSGTGWVSSFVSAPDGVIAFVQGNDGTSEVYRLDVDTLTWTLADEPAIPEGFSPWGFGTHGAVLYSIEDFSQYDGDVPTFDEPFTITMENDGYVLEGVIDNASQTFTLIDKATGDVVVTESADSLDSGALEYLVENNDTVEILSPETGEIITVFGPDDLEAATREPADGPASTDGANDAPAATDVPAATVLVDGGFEAYEESPAMVEEYFQPELNVLATNGEVWINQALDLSGGDGTDVAPEDVLYPNEAVVNNGIVLISMSDGSFIRLTF